MDFKEYKTDLNPDGSVNIRGLDIFRLCERAGKKYDQAWFSSIFKLHENERKDGYLPPAVVGHERKEGEEPPSIGLIDNLQLSGETVYADVLKVPSSDFEKMKDRRWPNRSVELHPETGQLMALSFLGKTRPFHKLPVMEFKGEQVEPVSIEFNDFEEIQMNKFFDKLRKVIGMSDKPKIKDDFAMTKEELTKFKEEILAEATQKAEANFDQKYVEKFKEEMGQTPAEFKTAQAESARKMFSEKVKLFAENLKKKLSLAPAIIDGFMVPFAETFSGRSSETIKFAEKKEGDIFTMLEKFAETVVELAKESKLTVDFSERAPGRQTEGNPNLKNEEFSTDILSGAGAEVTHKKIVKFMNDNKIESYEKAAEKFFELNPNG